LKILVDHSSGFGGWMNGGMGVKAVLRNFLAHSKNGKKDTDTIFFK
jgi:hypothetical protein